LISSCLVLVAASAWDCIAREPADAPRPLPFDERSAKDSKAADTSPIARLDQRLEKGQASLPFDPFHGYLLGVLKELQVPMASQILVFSKTSAQGQHISPATPRAIYFNDQVFVAWTPRAPLLELAALDPKAGAAFYTVEQQPDRAPRFTRCQACLDCHATATTLGVPGLLVRSTATDETGSPRLGHSISAVNHRTPLAVRWAGWYVCGTLGGQIHQGNRPGLLASATTAAPPAARDEPADLSRFLDICRYPEPTSDVVALLVFDHQAHMQNLLIRLREEAEPLLEMGEDLSRLNSLADACVRYMLFADETPLAGPIQGASSFAAWFERQGPSDRHGRSLRQFDLQTRLFRYPCSFLIYSGSFDKLPRAVKLHLYRRLWLALCGESLDPAFQRIPAETRRAILDILIDTKPDVPVYWTL
jgi:hypothetical protein